MTQGFILIPAFSSDVWEGGGVEQNDRNGLGEEICGSTNLPLNVRRMSDFG